ncbi:MAG: cell division ATP-binding protein FtsE [Ignavibacteriales bacterium]
MLEFNNVTFEYPNQLVLSDLNYSMKPGEFTFLVGKSGAGKSTFLQLIYMNIAPKSGHVRFEKYDSRMMNARELPDLRRKIGIIFQDFRLLDDRSVYDNLAFILEVTGSPVKEVRKKVFHVLSEVGLLHKQKNLPHELSGGEQQRIAIARAIINNPLLILADEPTGNLDPETSNEILELLKKINSRGTSVILATHNYDLVRKYNARIIKLENGKAVKVVIKQNSPVT